MTDPWKETTLQTILTNYAKTDIYNADEFGLFFKALPRKTLHLKGENCTGGKPSKIIVTGLAAANMNSDKLPMLFQEYQKITSPLLRPEKNLNGFNAFRRMGQRA